MFYALEDHPVLKTEIAKINFHKVLSKHTMGWLLCGVKRTLEALIPLVSPALTASGYINTWSARMITRHSEPGLPPSSDPK